MQPVLYTMAISAQKFGAEENPLAGKQNSKRAQDQP
jgi:hypothetical protein